MFNETGTFIMLNTLTPTHPGSGTEINHVDLPIQRESSTGIPKIEASTLKGCIRHSLSQSLNPSPLPSDNIAAPEPDNTWVNQVFGKEGESGYASALSLSDAKLLFFPVKSAFGVFAWVTCPFVIQRFCNDYRIVFGHLVTDTMDFQISSGEALVPEDENCDNIKKENKHSAGDSVLLEEYVYKTKPSKNLKNFLDMVIESLPDNDITKNRFLNHTLMISDDDFVAFTKYSTEVCTRIKINANTKTVAANALFTEEFLPSECILYCMAFFHNAHYNKTITEETPLPNQKTIKQEFLERFSYPIFQIGADSTLGKGLVMQKIWEGKEQHHA